MAGRNTTGSNTTKNQGKNTNSKTSNSRNSSSRNGGTRANSKNSKQIDNSYTSKRKSAARRAIEQEEDNASRRNEIYVFIYLAVAVFLICSNFGWCGVVGDFISKIIFGLVGSVAYILPIYLFFSAAFLFSNGAHRKIVKRVLCAGIFIIVIAFVCQMLAGADEQTVKSLYLEGSKDKRGGGVLLGGILVVLHKLMGLTGSIIVTVLLTIIGIIIVMDVSLIETMKNKLAWDEDDEDEDDYPDNELAHMTSEEIRNREKPNMMNSIMVLESKDKKSKASKTKKPKNKIVPEEEVHELKPVMADELFTLEQARNSEAPVDLSNARRDFFDKPEFAAKQANIKEAVVIDDGDDFGSGEDTLNVTPKRKPRKTKESQAEMVAERDAIAQTINSDINSGSAVAMSNKNVPSGQMSMNISGDGEFKKEYQFPPIELLKTGKGKPGVNNEASVRETAMKLKSTLESFGVNVTVTDYSCGPSVTRYELQPEQGVKVNKIVGLADDIKLNLAAADIRIEAPIPGKAAIGIEVPNKESSSVYFRDLLETDTFKKYPSNISFAVGKDISGDVVVADIAKMPHLLVAGATGSGKSVCINTLIMSIIYKAKPEDVKMIMIDPKQVELSIYNGIPHLLIPVVTDPKKAAGALNWAVMEMTNRYQLFAQYNVRNLQGYNEKVKAVTGFEEGNEDLKKLPQIILIVDELADLMMVAHHEVEDAIVRLSQLARAAGIHLVIATQRPSVDVITGLIKANVPSRIAMTVSSGVDSRTILDMNGAEKLLGKGDMLFYPTGYPKPVRVQGAFLSDEEIAGVVDFLKEQNGETTYDDKISQEISSSSAAGGSGASGSDSDVDEYFVDAGKFIIGKDKASIGMLQRVYKIGFNRAARIMDQLSDAGVVGPEEGTKPRKVLMTMEEFENYVENNL